MLFIVIISLSEEALRNRTMAHRRKHHFAPSPGGLSFSSRWRRRSCETGHRGMTAVATIRLPAAVCGRHHNAAARLGSILGRCLRQRAKDASPRSPRISLKRHSTCRHAALSRISCSCFRHDISDGHHHFTPRPSPGQAMKSTWVLKSVIEVKLETITCRPVALP